MVNKKITKKSNFNLESILSILKTVLNEYSKATTISFLNSVVAQFGLITKRETYSLKNGVELNFKPGTLDLMVIRECLINNLYIKYIKERHLDTVLDLGCHKGYFIAGLLSDGVNIKKAICVDPLMENIDVFKRNIKNNKKIFKKIKDNIIFENSAIFLKTGKKDFFVTSNSVNHSLNDPSEYDEVIRKVKTKTISIGDLFKKYELSSIDLVKIDIEGTEFDLFRSSSCEMLLKTRYLVMEIHPNKNNISIEIHKRLVDSGFTIHYPNPAYKDLIVAIRE